MITFVAHMKHQPVQSDEPDEAPVTCHCVAGSSNFKLVIGRLQTEMGSGKYEFADGDGAVVVAIDDSRVYSATESPKTVLTYALKKGDMYAIWADKELEEQFWEEGSTADPEDLDGEELAASALLDS